MAIVTAKGDMKKFSASLDGQEVIVLEVSLDRDKALIAITPPGPGIPAKLKVVPIDSLDLSIQQLTQLRLGVRDDIN